MLIMSNIQLTNTSVSQQNIQEPKPIQSTRCKTIIALVVGIIVALGGLFMLLAACRVLPNSIATSHLHEIGKIFSPIVIVAGIGAFAYGIYQACQLEKMTGTYFIVSSALHSNRAVSKEDLTEYLSIQIKDGNFSEIQNSFPKLDLDSQGKLFGVAAEEGLLSNMMDQVPKNMKQLKVGFGHHLSWHDFDRACAAVDQFASKLNDFKELEHITLDLSKVAYYTDTVRNHAESMLKLLYTFSAVHINQPYEDYVRTGGGGSPNNARAAINAMVALMNYMKDKPSITAHIQFGSHQWVTICPVSSTDGPQLKLIPARVEIS